MPLPSPRQFNMLVVAVCAALIGVALALQLVLELHPCALCITQRIFVIAVGLVALVAVVHNPAATGIRVYGVLGLLLAVCGGAVAARHVYIQHLPADQVPACGPSLQYMFEVFPFMEALKLLLAGDGNCAIVDWTFLGMSIPEMTLVAFAGLAAASLFQVIRRT